MLEDLMKDLNNLQDCEKAKILARFFKTGKGEYGEGDKFLGIIVPDQRKVAKKYKDLPLEDIQTLLESEIHEYRLTGLFILTAKYLKADDNEKLQIVQFYLKNTKRINNWDLVDLSASVILGDWFFDKDKSVLYKLAVSENLWERRISMLATFGFIRKYKFDDTFKICEILMNDNHDLIHKACGWMLREIGKKNQESEEIFLRKYYKIMPRTMLRYAIEKFDADKKAFYMGK